MLYYIILLFFLVICIIFKVFSLFCVFLGMRVIGSIIILVEGRVYYYCKEFVRWLL